MKKRSAAGWHPADIVAAVRKKGQSLTGISLGLGLTSSSASRALIFPHPRVNRAIAEVIGEPPCALWPQWFDGNGERIGARATGRSRSEPRTAAEAESRAAPESSTQNAA